MNRMDRSITKEGMLFIPFIVAGDPCEEASVALALTLQSAGARAIELGIPYSDPLADGPVIQKGSKRALRHGITLRRAMDLAGQMRAGGLKIPVVAFTYANPLYQLGQDAFFQRAAANGIDGLLIPDLPFEESRALARRCAEKDIRLISLVAPTTSGERLRKIGAAAQGFVYCVSSLGVTGVRSQFHPAIFPFLKRVRRVTSLPVAVGFGISRRSQVEELTDYADGFIVGSAIVREVEKRAARLEQTETRAQALAEIKETLEENLLISGQEAL